MPSKVRCCTRRWPTIAARVFFGPSSFLAVDTSRRLSIAPRRVDDDRTRCASSATASSREARCRRFRRADTAKFLPSGFDLHRLKRTAPGVRALRPRSGAAFTGGLAPFVNRNPSGTRAQENLENLHARCRVVLPFAPDHTPGNASMPHAR
jgi:hypothetical protein